MIQKKDIQPIHPELQFENGFGGFDSTRHEYRIQTSADAPTPMPWINIIANPEFGGIITESGAGCTWFKNSYLFRITPWINDPVLEQSGEMLFLRDESTFDVWSPTPAPLPQKNQYTVRHGHGYTVFESENHGLMQSLRIDVSSNDPVKYFELKLSNTTAKTKNISATMYAQWLLGDFLEKNRMHLQSEVQPEHSRIIARNPLAGVFSEYYGFLGTDQAKAYYCTNRSNFFGKNNATNVPEMLLKKYIYDAALSEQGSPKLSGANDQCAAVQVFASIEPGAESVLVFYLGADTYENLNRLAPKIKSYDADCNVQAAFWKSQLTNIQIKTPNEQLNVLWNEQLLYQLLTSRLWGRVALYQPGGAFGFRDQLQDVLALVWASPDMTREHIVLAASRQFVEGDVQHWWHPPVGQGVRSELSDPHLWLVYAVAHYLKITGDATVLDQQIPFLSSANPEHRPGAYFVPAVSLESGTLYEHCIQALELTLGRIGSHGLPLILAGDWNDGLNNIGIRGTGESVWLAFFLAKVLNDFKEIASERRDYIHAARYAEQVTMLTDAIEKNCWDGQWYIRAFWDDGKKMGSSENNEAMIDSLVQSWAVISGLGDPKKNAQALASVATHLISKDHQLLSILTPPFQKSDPEPGYIQTYPPGMRENGGSYTHAAAWGALAEALMGNGDRAMEILNMSNPFLRTATADAAKKYGAEPYVLASDITTLGEDAGRAGWTWYTGSAGVYYSVVLENIVGIQQRAGRLFFKPCVPKTWQGFSAVLKYKTSVYTILFENPDGLSSGVSSIALDDVLNKDFLSLGVALIDDGKKHNVKVTLGKIA